MMDNGVASASIGMVTIPCCLNQYSMPWLTRTVDPFTRSAGTEESISRNVMTHIRALFVVTLAFSELPVTVAECSVYMTFIEISVVVVIVYILLLLSR